jgi:hypothetical protein
VQAAQSRSDVLYAQRRDLYMSGRSSLQVLQDVALSVSMGSLFRMQKKYPGVCTVKVERMSRAPVCIFTAKRVCRFCSTSVPVRSLQGERTSEWNRHNESLHMNICGLQVRWQCVSVRSVLHAEHIYRRVRNQRRFRVERTAAPWCFSRPVL